LNRGFFMGIKKHSFGRSWHYAVLPDNNKLIIIQQILSGTNLYNVSVVERDGNKWKLVGNLGRGGFTTWDEASQLVSEIFIKLNGKVGL